MFKLAPPRGRVLFPVAHVLAIGFFIAMTGCGGSSGGAPAPPLGPVPPPAPQNGEYLFATGSGPSLAGFRIDSSTGTLSASTVPTPMPGLSSGIASDVLRKFIYVGDKSSVGVVFGYSSESGNGSVLNVIGSPFPATAPNGATPEPVALVVSPSGKYLYVSSRLGPPSDIDVFSIDGTMGTLAFASLLTEAQAQFRHVGIDPSGNFLYGINVAVRGGGVYVYRITPNTGALAAVPGSPFATPDEPWDIAVHASGKFLYTCMTHTQGVVGFSIDGSTGALTVIPGSPFPSDVQPGSVTADPSGKFLYVHTLGGTISAYTIDAGTGALTAIPGSPFSAGPSSAGGVTVEPSGKFLYVANFANSSIYVFNIDQNAGVLNAVPGSPFPAGTPPNYLTSVKVP
jgi:6-phosphogluconolactonase (cycloisomerase 2 family)